MEYVYLVGSEQVDRAGYNFLLAAEMFQHSVNQLENAIHGLSVDLQNTLENLRVSLEPPAASPSTVEKKVYVGTEEYKNYAAKRFSDPGSMSFPWEGHRWAYRYTSFDDEGEYHLIYRNI